jgi:protein Mpv17
MSYFLKHSKIAAPMGAFALTSASSILMGRQTSHQTSKKATQTASRYLNSCAQSQLHKYSRQNLPLQNQNQYQRRFLSSETSKGAASAAKETSVKSSSGGGFVAWYESHLQARPIATKAVTGSILWGLGDIVAQVVPSMMENDDKAPPAQEHDTQLVAKKKDFEYDYPRTARAMFFGFAIHAPLSHVHFNFLEWMTIKGAFTGLSIPIFKTVMEQFVYWSWISNSLYHGAMGAMQGKTFQQVYDRIADVLWDTQKAQWVFWIPVQLLNFRFVPVRHQLNVVLLTSVVWTALLSAWYPPEEENECVVKEESEEKK